MRGGRKPLLVELISNFAEGSGLFVPTPTFWAKVKSKFKSENAKKRRCSFFIPKKIINDSKLKMGLL
jgi:hypothetical protein